jgi:thiamine-phosphate pyrophosphorylase
MAAKAPEKAAGLDVFYPIVPDVAWLGRIVRLGVKTVQLRLKEASPDRIRREITESLEICARHDCQLIVNDYWREALSLGADYIHLGQEDLADADVPAIQAKGARLGISTHSEEELATALAANPSYVALGPIYETRLKVMKWAPQGLERIAHWKKLIGARPLVAIGGLTPERAAAVQAAGADSLAVITDFFTHSNPEARVREWLAWAEKARPQGSNDGCSQNRP